MRKALIGLLLFLMGSSAGWAAPVVSNIRASQRTDGSCVVDIYYNLTGAVGPCTVSLVFSNDNGAHWDVLPAMTMLQGDFGNGINNGINRHITWDAGRDRPEIYWPQAQAKITASETGQSINIMLPGAVPLVMVRVPSGSFTMGSSLDPGYSQANEAPPHTVSIGADFYLGKFELTQEQWWAVMGNNPANHQGVANLPVEQVSWNDCQGFLTKLNSLGAGTFRLPSEAEWEYACRAGSTTRWCYGDDPAQLGNYAWDVDNSGSSTHPVGLKLPNAWGLYDMHGNVDEWVQDWWHGDYNGAPTDGSAWESPTGTSRILRGGGFYSTAAVSRSAIRNYGSTPNYRGNALGVRLVRIP